MFQTQIADYISASESESSVRRLNLRLRRENEELKQHVERLRILLSDVSEMEEEKHQMLEAFDRSCEREEELKKRLKEEEIENDCLSDALMDLRLIKIHHKASQVDLQNLRQAVFRAKWMMDEVQYALAERDEIIQRRHAETEELLALQEDCLVHLEENRVRLQDAEEAVRVMERLPTRERGPCEVRQKKKKKKTMVHSEVRPSRVKDMLITLGSFTFTLLFLFFFISSVIPAFSSEEISDIVVTELIPDRLTISERGHLTGPVSGYHPAWRPLPRDGRGLLPTEERGGGERRRWREKEMERRGGERRWREEVERGGGERRSRRREEEMERGRDGERRRRREEVERGGAGGERRRWREEEERGGGERRSRRKRREEVEVHQCEQQQDEQEPGVMRSNLDREISQEVQDPATEREREREKERERVKSSRVTMDPVFILHEKTLAGSNQVT
ncbi:hypothetical protein QTP86_033685 [Hemibagrus guttatus]|nr:hypothetical protein QTP86_033685 [Hemibagrus guttatus]